MTPSVAESRDTCRYFVSIGPSVVVLHAHGRASMQNCRAFARFLEIHAQSAPGKRLYFNFAKCPSVDSTVAGLIAKSAYDRVQGSEWGRVGIINASERVQDTLRSLGLRRVADFLRLPEESVPPGQDALADHVDVSGACLPDEIFRAHEALIVLDESNVDRFADVLCALRDDPAMSCALESAMIPPPEPPASRATRIPFALRSV